jgi:hypothetical protein
MMLGVTPTTIQNLFIAPNDESTEADPAFASDAALTHGYERLTRSPDPAPGAAPPRRHAPRAAAPVSDGEGDVEEQARGLRRALNAT